MLLAARPETRRQPGMAVTGSLIDDLIPAWRPDRSDAVEADVPAGQDLLGPRGELPNDEIDRLTAAALVPFVGNPRPVR